MKLNIYSVFDTVAQVFNKPFTDINNDTAKRIFIQSAQEDPNKNDYVLYWLGSFTDHDGDIIPLNEPQKVLSGFDVHKVTQTTPVHLQEQSA